MAHVFTTLVVFERCICLEVIGLVLKRISNEANCDLLVSYKIILSEESID